jgi:hypothetical protein
MNRPATWKLVTLGTALGGLGLAGAGVALADDRAAAGTPVPQSIAVSEPALSELVGVVDGSPESADSPFASVQDSADSPFDSPDDLALPPTDSAGSAHSADSAHSPDSAHSANSAD